MSAVRPPSPNAIVPVMLNGGRVTGAFRGALFSVAARAGVSINEFVLLAAAEKLRCMGEAVDGVFEPGDLISNNDNDGTLRQDRAAHGSERQPPRRSRLPGQPRGRANA